MESHVYSQREAVKMLKKCGLSRRSAYYRLGKLPSRVFLDTNVYSRVDVDLLCERLRLEQGEVHDEPARASGN